jgi:hypothetical protein
MPRTKLSNRFYIILIIQSLNFSIHHFIFIQ